MATKIKVIFSQTNQIKEVAAGYALNYLFPKGLAVSATPESLQSLEKKQKLLEADKKKFQKQATELATRLNQLKLTIKAKVKKDKQLYGGVNRQTITVALGKKLGKTVLKEGPQLEVLLDKPIKVLGESEVDLKIGQTRAKVRVAIVKE